MGDAESDNLPFKLTVHALFMQASKKCLSCEKKLIFLSVLDCSKAKYVFHKLSNHKQIHVHCSVFLSVFE